MKKEPIDLRKTPYHSKLLSHRARVQCHIENTFEAFREVLKMNVKYIELDIRFSADHVAYIYHNAYFQNGKEIFRFADKTWKEIETYRYKKHHIPMSRLDVILEYFSQHKKDGQMLAIDLKDFGYEQEIYDMCKKYNVLDAVIVFTWTPQIIFSFDTIFKREKKSFPLYFSHVRVDSILTHLGIPWFLNYQKFFVNFRDFVLIGDANYKKPLGKYAKGYRHVSYFSNLPEDLIRILVKYKGGICVTKKAYDLGDSLLKKYKDKGLRIAIFGAMFGIMNIQTKKDFYHEAKKEYVDMVFVDSLNKMAVL